MKAKIILENLEYVQFEVTEDNTVGLFGITTDKFFHDGNVLEQTRASKVIITIRDKNALELRPVFVVPELDNSAWERLCSFHDVTAIRIIFDDGTVQDYCVPYSEGPDFAPNEYMETLEDGNHCFIFISKDAEWRNKMKARQA